MGFALSYTFRWLNGHNRSSNEVTPTEKKSLNPSYGHGFEMKILSFNHGKAGCDVYSDTDSRKRAGPLLKLWTG